MDLVVFVIGKKEYGIEVGQIQEVIMMQKLTPVPEAAEFVEGVISLHGHVVSIVNLRKKLGFESDPKLLKTNRILVTKHQGHFVGIVVDDVSGVLPLGKEQISPADDVLKEARYLCGVVNTENRLILVIDVEKLFSDTEKTNIKTVEARVQIKRKE
jgi:purine-binding chemotaxis protein CheW